MLFSRDPNTLTTTFQISELEARSLTEHLPNYLVRRLGEEFATANLPKLLKDKAFVAEVHRLAAEKAADILADKLSDAIVNGFKLESEKKK